MLSCVDDWIGLVKYGYWSHACGETRNVERVKELLDEPVYEIGRIVKKRWRKCGD